MLSRPSKAVGHAEMMEMLTSYDYTIDLTSDADGAPETWGPEGGYGIISARKMLAWVEANCGEACPGEGTLCRTIKHTYVSRKEAVLGQP